MSSNNLSIEVKSLSKCYHIYSSPIDRLKQFFYGRLKKNPFYKEFWALKDVSLQIKKGEAFAIIGRNGAGKSTLLQIIAGVLKPTSGEINVNGRVGALLELGSGFNPEFTGKENVYLNGAIFGFKKSEMDTFYNKIIEFADIGQFIDQPIKMYSSGMIVRLAFAVQAFTNPEILIVDEALSVGDLFFAQKCARLMQELREKGTTIIFVSHDMSSVRNMCNQAAYLKHGQLISHGPTQQVIREYYLDGASNNDTSAARGVALENEKVKVLDFKAQNETGESSFSMQLGQKVKFIFKWKALTDLKNIHSSISIKNKLDQVVFCGGSFNQKQSGLSLTKNQVAEFAFEIDCDLEAGKYSIWLSVGEVDYQNPTCAKNVLEFILPEPLTVLWDYEKSIPPFYGMVQLPYSVKNQILSDF